MKAISKEASAILEAMISDLVELGDSKKIDNANGSYMPVHVERIGENRFGVMFSVAHYGEQCGDLMRDPEMIFLARHGYMIDNPKAQPDQLYFFPIYFRNDYMGIERFSVEFDEADSIIRYDRREQRDEAIFANTWMANIKEQQEIAIS